MSVVMKVGIHQAAATLAAGVMANLKDELGPDPEIKNEVLRAHNLMAWELHRIFYHAINAAVQSDQWPAPDVIDEQARQGLAGLVEKFSGNPAIQTLLQALVGRAVQEIAPEVKPEPTPLPNPAA